MPNKSLEKLANVIASKADYDGYAGDGVTVYVTLHGTELRGFGWTGEEAIQELENKIIDWAKQDEN
jgi:hypothetical protein